MSLSAELKDFTGGFKSGFDMYNRYRREKDLADYRKAKLADNTLPSDFGPGGASGAGGASSGASGGVKLSPEEQKATARKIYSSLLDKGYTTNAAAGITGNLWHESGGFGGGSGDSGSAHGIAQWRGDRWTKMQAYAKSVGKDPNDLNTQVDYLDKELKTDYKSAYNLLQHSSDIKTATGIFADQYERPAGAGKGNYGGISGMSNRLNFASQVANFGGGAIGTKPMSPTARIRALSTGPQASLGAAPSQVGTSASYLGAPPPETTIGEDTTSTATGAANQFASADEPPDDSDEDVEGAARGGLIKGYATGGAVEKDDDFIVSDKKLNTAFNPVFRKSLLDLQRRATAAGIKTHLISGVRTLDDQKELYANYLAGQAGKPLPYPKRGAVALAAKPGTSPHEKGMAADLAVDDPRDRARLVELSKSDPNLRHIADDPNHFELNTKGGDAPETAVASKGAVPPPPPDVPEEEADDADTASAGGGQPEEERSGNTQGLADATERGRQNQAYMASEAQYAHQRLMQEGASNAASLDQEAAARSTPPPPVAQAQPQEAEGAARGGLIRGYAPGGVVDATGYIAPNTATLSASTQALAPAVAAASQATPQPAVPTTVAAAPAVAAPAAPAAPAAQQSPDDIRKSLQGIMYPNGNPDPYASIRGAHVSTPAELAAWGRLSPDQQKWMTDNPQGPALGSPARAMQNAGYGDWSQLDPSLGHSSNGANNSGGYGAGISGGAYSTRDTGGFGGSQRYTAYNPQGVAQPQTVATKPVITGTTRGSVWNPTTKAWEAGVGYAGGGSVRGYADGGDVVDDDTDEAVSTAPAPAPAPAPVAAPAAAQPTPSGDARTRAGAPGMTDPAAPAAPDQKPPPPPPNLVADALHDGLVHLTKMFGLDKLGAVRDPDAQARVQAFNNGAGAADGEAMHAVHRAVDPNNQMTQQELATASVAAVKSYYDAKGQPEAGAKAIGEIMQHQKAISAHFSATAAQAFQQGDVANGLKFLKAAYDQVPDGQHIDAAINADGTVAYRLTDSHSGRVIHQGTANAQQLAKLAQAGSTGTPYVKAVATSAARAKTPTVPGGAPPMPPSPRPPGAVDATQQGPESGQAPPDSSVYTGNRGLQPSDMPSSGVGVSKDDQPAPAPAPTPPVDDSQASAAPGGSGAYLAQRQAALTSGVSPGAVDTGTRVAAADTVKTDATVDGKPPKVTVAQEDTAPRPSPAPPGKPVGLVAPGNIDLAHRPIYKQPDGRISTVNSIGVEDEDGKQVVIPTIIDGKQVSNKEAWAHYLQTGEFLGKFDTIANANQFGKDLHRAQADYYKNGPPSEDDEAVPTDGKKPLVLVPDTPLVRPEDKKVTPTKVDEKPIPEELTKPVVSKPEKADQAEVPDVAPVTPRNVGDDYDLTPKTFDKPPPNPDDYFDRYKRTAARYPAGNTAVRKALKTMYDQANTAYREADTAWKDEKSVFETEEGKRLQAANEQANRAQGIENTTSSEQHGIDMEKRKETIAANIKAQERADSEADKIAAQQAGLNDKEVARIVDRNKEDRAAARDGDKEAQKRLDKTADDLVQQKRENDKRAHDEAIKQNQDIEAANAKQAEEDAKRQQKIDDDYRTHNWDTDKEARALAEANRKEAEIKPPTSDEQKALDEKLAEAPKDGVAPLDDMYASFMDPDTGEKYTDPAKMKKDLGTSTVNGIRELVGHLIHANGMTPATAVDIAKQLVNSDLDTPGPTDDQSDYPGRRDREPQEFFKVAPKPDKAGNPIIKVPGYAPFKISPEMSSSVLEMQKSIREHSAKVRGWATSRDALTKVRGDARSGTVSGAVDASVQAGKNILFPTKPVTTNEPIVPSASKPKKFGPEGGFKFQRATPEEIKKAKEDYPPGYFGDQ